MAYEMKIVEALKLSEAIERAIKCNHVKLDGDVIKWTFDIIDGKTQYIVNALDLCFRKDLVYDVIWFDEIFG